VVDFYEHGNEPSGSIQGGGYSDNEVTTGFSRILLHEVYLALIYIQPHQKCVRIFNTEE
jgi:hypothetical protein